MKAITEAMLREELKSSKPDTYYIPEAKMLTPAAREYLQQCKIKIAKGLGPEISAAEVAPMPRPEKGNMELEPKYVDYVSGAFYTVKPEHMTHLYGNVLVNKNHPHILFRGKLDSLQALVVLTQCQMMERGASGRLLEHLQDILSVLREIMRCDVMDEHFEGKTIIGLTHAQLRERSHDPMKFYNIKQMVLPEANLGTEYAMLNRLRTEVRGTEAAAAQAFYEGGKFTRGDIIQELNRLSSALHILMCMYLAGEFR